MSQPLTLRTEAGDEDLDLAEFEGRVRRGDVSPQCLVRFPAVTGSSFVPACELQIWKALHEPKKAHFFRAFSLLRFPWLTATILALNLGVHLWALRGGPLDMDAMITFGGKAAPLVFDLGEFWRLVVANFLHWNFVHLGVNMFVLLNVGGALENAFRRLDYLFLLVFSGLCTMGLSLWAFPEAVTVGASGMVYGCLGGIIAFGLKYRTILPTRYRRILGEAAIPIVLLLFLMGVVSPGVDNAAHVGGLLAGLLVAPFLRPRLLAELPRSRWAPAMRAAPSAGLLVILLFGRALFADMLPFWSVQRRDDFGVAVAVPSAWREGANRFGQMAFFNGLPGAGRAELAVGVTVQDEVADVQAYAERFADEHLRPEALGPSVFKVSQKEPVPARLGDRDALLLRAHIDERHGRTHLWAYFVPRGRVIYQIVLSFPDAYPRYAQLMEQVAQNVRFEEPRALRQARAQALLFPQAPWAMAALGEMLHRLGDPWGAMEALEVAVRGAPAQVAWRAQLGWARLDAGQVEAGCMTAEEAVLYGPLDPFALEVDARCELARGNPKGALDRILEARKASPQDPRLQRAEAALREAVEASGG